MSSSLLFHLLQIIATRLPGRLNWFIIDNSATLLSWQNKNSAQDNAIAIATSQQCLVRRDVEKPRCRLNSPSPAADASFRVIISLNDYWQNCFPVFSSFMLVKELPKPSSDWFLLLGLFLSRVPRDKTILWKWSFYEKLISTSSLSLRGSWWLDAD